MIFLRDHSQLNCEYEGQSQTPNMRKWTHMNENRIMGYTLWKSDLHSLNNKLSSQNSLRPLSFDFGLCFHDWCDLWLTLNTKLFGHSWGDSQIIFPRRENHLRIASRMNKIIVIHTSTYPFHAFFMSKHTNLTKPNTDRKFRSYHQRWPNLNNHVLWNFANVKHCYCESIPCLLRRLRNFINTQRRNTTCHRRSTVEQLCQVWIHISVSMRERVGTLFPFSNDAYRVPKGFKVLNTCQCFKSGMNHRNMQNVRSYRSTRKNIHYRDCHCDVINTETEMLSFWWNFHHWLHWKLSFWQLSVQPVMKISSKWRHFRFSVNDVRSLPHVTSQPRGIVCYPIPRDDSCFWLANRREE